MLYGLSKQIANCYRRAAEYRERAESAVSESDRKFYLVREQDWLKLARSYELSERISRIVNELQRRGCSMRKQPVKKAFPNCPSCAVTMKFEDSRPARGVPVQAVTAVEAALFVCPNCARVRDELFFRPRY